MRWVLLIFMWFAVGCDKTMTDPAVQEGEVEVEKLGLSRVKKWIEDQSFHKGTHRNVKLPDDLVSLSHDGVVNIVALDDHCVIALLKAHVGWKGNYEGFVVSTCDLPKDNLSKDYNGRITIVVEGLDAVEPIVKRRIDEGVYEVFFDLG